jgi:hypothetical protein
MAADLAIIEGGGDIASLASAPQAQSHAADCDMQSIISSTEP